MGRVRSKSNEAKGLNGEVFSCKGRSESPLRKGGARPGQAGRKEGCVPGKGNDLGEGTEVDDHEQQEEEGKRGSR